MTTVAVYLLFLLSGCVGLVYEVTWLRQFRIVMGNTVFTSATVLTAFMGGMALGSLVASRVVDRVARPLRAYAILEVFVGLYALILPWLLGPLEPVYAWLFRSLPEGGLVLALARFAVSATLLLLPTTLMGATLPLLSRHVTSGIEWVGRDVGRLYGLNTLGAAAGALLAGFVLVPQLGVTATLYAGAVGNAVVCIAAVVLDRQGRTPRTAPSMTETPAPTRSRLQLAVIGAIAAAGCASMVYEVAWTRTLTLLIGSSVYAFTLMLGAFITGLGAGGWLLSGWSNRSRDPVRFLGGLQLVVAVSSSAVVPLFTILPGAVVGLVTNYASSFRILHTLEFVTAFGLMLVPTLAMGAVFPTVTRIYTRDLRSLGRSVGEAYAANTLGAVVGSFLAGFVLIPLVGARAAILLAVATNTILGLAFWLRGAGRAPARWLPAAAVVTGLIAVAAWAPRWDPLLLNSAPYLYAYSYEKAAQGDEIDLDRAITKNRRLLYAEQGLTAAVTVVESGGETYLKVNGKTDASFGDRRTQSLLCHLPLLHHPEPQRALLVGLGSGISLGALLKHPVPDVECVEISPEVVNASRFFRQVNGDPLTDPRVQLFIGDGRNHVSHGKGSYDLIISQPSNLWIAGMADLFTVEFFEACRDRLAPGGIVTTWVQAYVMRTDDFKSIVRTFAEVFPHAQLWESVPGGDYYLVGSMDRELSPDRATWQERAQRRDLQPALQAVGVESVDDILCSFVMGGEPLRAFARAGGRLNTDDNAHLEFSSPHGLYQGLVGDDGILTVGTLDGHRSTRPPYASAPDSLQVAWRARQAAVQGLVALEGHDFETAHERLRAAAALRPQDMEVRRAYRKLALDYGARLSVGGDTDGALALYREALRVLDEAPVVQVRLGELLEARGVLADAIGHYRRAVEENPRYLAAHLRLAAAYGRHGRHTDADAVMEAALALDPHDGAVYNEWGKLALARRDWTAAADRFGDGIAVAPDDAQLRNNLGVALFQAGDVVAAAASFEAAVDLHPGYVRAHCNLGDARRRLEEPEAARRAYEAALRLDPDQRRAQAGLRSLPLKGNG